LTAEQLGVVHIYSTHTESVDITLGSEVLSVRPGDNDFAVPVQNGVRINVGNFAGTITDDKGSTVASLNVQATTIRLTLKPLDKLQFKNNPPGIIRPNYVSFNSKQNEFVVGYNSIPSATGGSSDAMVAIYDARTGVPRFLKGHTDAVATVIFNCDDTKIISGTASELRIWDAANGLPRDRILQSVKAIVPHPTEPNWFMVLDPNGLITIYNSGVSVGKIPSTMRNPDIFAYSTDGAHILVGQNGGVITAYDAVTGTKSNDSPTLYQRPIVGRLSARISGSIVELIDLAGAVRAQIGYFGGPEGKDYVTIAGNGYYVSASGANTVNRFQLAPPDGGRIRDAERTDLNLRNRPEMVSRELAK
jgi:WD40 repeat protein